MYDTRALIDPPPHFRVYSREKTKNKKTTDHRETRSVMSHAKTASIMLVHDLSSYIPPGIISSYIQAGPVLLPGTAIVSFNQYFQTHTTRTQSEKDKAHPQGGKVARATRQQKPTGTHERASEGSLDLGARSQS